MEDSITLLELFEIIALFSLPVSLIARIIQFVYLRQQSSYTLLTLISIIILSEIVSFFFTGLFWKFWPFKVDIMFHFLCLPTILGELIILSVTFMVLKKQHVKWV